MERVFEAVFCGGKAEAKEEILTFEILTFQTIASNSLLTHTLPKC